LLEDEEIKKVKPQSEQNDEESDVNLEIDSEKKDQNGDGPSQNASFFSNNLSQISRNSNIGEIRQIFSNNRKRGRRSRAFLTNNSRIMN